MRGMDVAIGDRPLRMAGLELDVCLRVAEAATHESLVDVEAGVEQFDVAPPERGQLAAPQRRTERDLDELP